jgi:G3E family GTPase
VLSDEQRAKLDLWVRSLLWEGVLLGVPHTHPISVHRTKGRVTSRSGEEWILQGVREIYEFKVLGKAHSESSKMVFIGEGLKQDEIEKSLYGYLGV